PQWPRSVPYDCWSCPLETLQGLVELADGLFLIETLVALKTFDGGVCRESYYFGQFCLTRARWPFGQDGLLHLGGKIDHLEGDRIRHVLGGLQLLRQLLDR